MEFIKATSYQNLSEIASNIIASQIILKPNSVLGLATGSTPIGTYNCLVEKYLNKDIDFSNITTINLDEYVGLNENHNQSYRYFMNKYLFDRININKENTFVPNGIAENLEEETKRYDNIINNYGIDLQLLGIGVDGHIGFNEPAEYFTKNTHAVTLDPSTIEANSRFFNSKSDVPTRAITMGMWGIMGAKRIILIANGKNKKDILEKALYGKITPQVPASILQLHKNLTVIYSEE